MKMNVLLLAQLMRALIGCHSNARKAEASTASPIVQDSVAVKVRQAPLPEPFATKSVTNFSKIKGWPNGLTPIAPAGFRVEKFADSLVNPRWIYIAPNGDVLVAEVNRPAN